MNHAPEIVADVMTVIGHAAPAAVGHTDATVEAACFEVDMAGLSARADPDAPFAVVATVDEVELLPSTPGVHPLHSVLTAVDGAIGVIGTTEGSFVDLTDPAGGRASWIVEGQLCFGEDR